MPRSLAFIVSTLPAVGLALVLGLTAATPARATPGQIYELKRPVVNLRAGPSRKAKVVSRVRKGGRLMEFARQRGWIKVREMGKLGPEGWVLATLVVPESVSAPPAPPPESSSEAGPPAGAGGYEEGPTVIARPRGRSARYLNNGILTPLGGQTVTVRKHGGRKGKGKGRDHGDRQSGGSRAAGARPGGLRTLGSPRTSGAPNVGSPRSGGAPNIGTF